MSDKNEYFQQKRVSGATSSRERLAESEQKDPSLTPLICKILQLSHDNFLAKNRHNHQ